jgi:hypothetical protein
MAGFTLHADFDRDGKTDGGAAERTARERFPGAILLPNLDNDNRALPASVKAASPAPLDSARAAARLNNDDELLAIGLVPDAGTSAPLDVFLGFTGWSPSKMTLLDAKRRVLRKTPGTFNFYTIGSIKTRSDLFIEVRTLAGSPLNRFQTLDTSFAESRIDERTINISLSTRDALGQDVSADTGQFTIAPWLMIGNSNPIEKLFICDVGDNEPSVKDVKAALADPSVLVIVPKDVSNGDAWLQDQFEVGFCHSPKGVQRLVVHLPRLRGNVTSRAATTNLAAFVRAHLPSRNIGLFEDFWERSIPVTDATGTRVDIAFQVSAAVAGVMSRARQLRGYLMFLATSVLATNPLVNPVTGNPLTLQRFPDFVTTLADVTTMAPLVRSGLTREAGLPGTATGRATLLTTFRADLAARLSAVNTSVAISAGAVAITAPGWTALIPPNEANQLSLRLDQIHHSSNYGGNIELGPPTKDAKLGKIVLGNAAFEKADFVDPDLKRFLFKQQVQPIVEISTEWLGVGHVDEVAAFVPAPQKGGHGILLASSGLALSILRNAIASHVAGLPPGAYDETPGAVTSRKLTSGLHPITMMLRGKQWQHVQQPSSTDINEPPLTYIRLVNFFQSDGFNIHSQLKFIPGPGADRAYEAAISVKEALFVEALKRHQRPGEPEPEMFTTPEFFDEVKPQPETLTTNDFIDQEFMATNRDTLVGAFPDVPIIDIPVLFDFIPDMDFASTRAFLPNAANLVVAGNRLLIPQQFGPRMKVDDAVAVIGAVLEEWATKSTLGANNNAKWVRSQGLVGVRQWFKGKTEAGDATINVGGLASDFEDGFPDLSFDDVGKKIRQANASAFRGNDLRPGWHKLSIPEETVDLFELYIALVVASIGLQAKFVDSWYYHLNHGEIHCGTNALRKPLATGSLKWWTL